MINRAVITGRLTTDPELKATQNGISVATFTVAVDRPFVNKQSNQREADFIRCVVWKKSAETFCQYTKKGSLVGIDGAIQTRSYDDKSGNRVYITEIRVDNFTFLDTKKSSEGANGDYSGYGNGNSTYNQPQTKDPFVNNSGSIDIADDDLPF